MPAARCWACTTTTALGRPLDCHEGSSAAAALGAARLAWMADGGTELEVARPLEAMRRCEPQLDQAGTLGERWARFRALYPVLQEHFTA